MVTYECITIRKRKGVLAVTLLLSQDTFSLKEEQTGKSHARGVYWKVSLFLSTVTRQRSTNLPLITCQRCSCHLPSHAFSTFWQPPPSQPSSLFSIKYLPSGVICPLISCTPDPTANSPIPSLSSDSHLPSQPNSLSCIKYFPSTPHSPSLQSLLPALLFSRAYC